METGQEKIKRPVANMERFIGDSEPGLAQRVQERPKKKRRSGDAVALGMTKEEEHYRPATLSHGGQGSYLAGGLAQSDPQSTYHGNSSRAKEAAAASWEEYRDWKRTSVEVSLKNGSRRARTASADA